MRVLALVPNPYDTTPAQRFRMEQWEPFLAQSGIDIDWAPFATDELLAVLYERGNSLRKLVRTLGSYTRRIRTMAALGAYDVVYVLRETALLGPAVLERWIARRLPYVFDFDDAIWLRYQSPTNKAFGRLRCAGKFATSCRRAAHVMAGNSYLADHAKRFNTKVTVVPTTIDTEKYRAKAAAHRDEVVLGWTGSHSTVQHLRLAHGALRQLAENTSFRLRVIGTDHHEVLGVPTEALPWRSTTEVADLSAVDIGLMPLPDDEWGRGKCGLKLLQYMALGIPPVCSPVGVNGEIVTDGHDGFLASTQAEWVGRLSQLIRSPELRERMGAAARRTVEERYDASNQAVRVAAILRGG